MAPSHYRNILKATSLIGGSSFINILIGMVRTKFVAVLLGPAGVGLMGMYGTITGMIATVSDMGLHTSGVRQIAESHGIGEAERIARTVITLRRTVWITGALGMLITIAGCAWWSIITFGSAEHAVAIALLGITILLGSVSMGQSCVLQGTRRIADIAKINIVGAINVTVIGIPCYYLWGMGGIVPSMLLGSVAALMTSWWFARRVIIKQIHLPWSESREEATRLMTIGIPLMLSGFAGTLTTYINRLTLIRLIGLEGIGIYQAALSLSSVIVSFVLSAMGADYYPRLTAVASDNKKIAHEVHAQTEIGLLLAFPGLAFTLVFVPVIVPLLYTGKFEGAIGVLRWLVFGIFGQIALWPLGYVILAKGRSKIMLWSELLVDCIWILLTWVCVKQWGINGAGIAFALLYGIVTGVYLTIIRSIADTTWSRSNLIHIIGMGSVLIGIDVNCHYSPFWIQWGINLILLAAASIYCLWRLSQKSGIGVAALLKKLGLKS